MHDTRRQLIYYHRKFFRTVFLGGKIIARTKHRAVCYLS